MAMAWVYQDDKQVKPADDGKGDRDQVIALPRSSSNT